MADEQQTYTYPDENTSNEYSKSSITGGTENFKSIITNKRVLMLIAFLVIILFMVFRKSSKIEEIVEQAPPVHKLVLPEITPVVPPAIPVPVNVAVNNNAVNNDSNLAQFANVNQEIDHLSDELKALSDNQDTIQSVQSDLVNKMDNIANVLVQIKQQQEAVLATEHSDSEFFIQAVIDGRAWITDNKNIYTVALGDKIAGYGVVTHIDPDEGFVSTSSGRNIIFPGN